MAESWIDAQNAVLGACLIEPELVGRLMMETGERDFTGPGRTLWTAMKELYTSGSPVDVVILAHRLGAEYTTYMKQLMELTPTAANFDWYLQIVRRQAKVTLLKDAALRLGQVESEEDAQALVDEMNGIVADENTVKVYTMADMLHSFEARMEKAPNYLHWPISALDSCLFVEPGELIVFGGAPSTGKTAFSLQCALHWAKTKRVGFFSLETDEKKLADRSVTSQTRVTFSDIKRRTMSEAAWKDYTEAADELARRQFEVIPAAGWNVTKIRAVALARRYDIIVLDYLQLIHGEGKTRVEQVTQVSLEVQRLAKSTGIIVFALSQLNRTRKEGKPDMTWFRESGQIEQDADEGFILTLEDKEDGPRILDIVKNKEGTRPSVRLGFEGNHQRFYRLDASGDVAQKLAHAGKQARRENRAAGQKQEIFRMADGTPVPF